MKRLVIGITGGIGSGKSTVSSILNNKGYITLLADDIAKNIMESDDKLIVEIKNYFGNDAYNGARLNTKYLAETVFGDPEKINLLNSIVHPPTIKFIEQKIKDLSRSHKIIFVESALIFEAGMEKLFNYILLVTAEEEIRINRTLNNSLESESQIKARMLHQIPEEIKRQRSHFIIDNNSTFKDLEEKTIFFLNLFESMIS